MGWTVSSHNVDLFIGCLVQFWAILYGFQNVRSLAFWFLEILYAKTLLVYLVSFYSHSPNCFNDCKIKVCKITCKMRVIFCPPNCCLCPNCSRYVNNLHCNLLMSRDQIDLQMSIWSDILGSGCITNIDSRWRRCSVMENQVWLCNQSHSSVVP